MIKKVKNYLINNPSLRRVLANSFFLSLSQLLAKLIMMVVFIYVARVLGPEDYGIYNSAFSFIFLMGLLSKLGFDYAIIREVSTQKNQIAYWQNGILGIRFWVAIFSLILALLLTRIFGFDSKTTQIVVLLSPLIVIGGSIPSGLTEHFATTFKIIEKMQFISRTVLLRVFIFAGLFFIIYLFGLLNLISLSIILLISSIISLLIIFSYANQEFYHKINLCVNKKILKILFLPVILFGINSFIYELSLRANIIMLNEYVSNSAAGIFSAGWQLLSAAILFIGSIGLSLFPNSARRIYDLPFRKKMGHLIIALSVIFIFGAIFVNYYSNLIITIIYGDSFVNADEVLSIIIWIAPIRMLSLWGHQVLESSGYLVTRIVIFAIPTILNILFNYFVIFEYKEIGVAYVTLSSNLLLLILSFVVAVIIIKKDKNFIKL